MHSVLWSPECTIKFRKGCILFYKHRDIKDNPSMIVKLRISALFYPCNMLSKTDDSPSKFKQSDLALHYAKNLCVW